MSNQRAASLLCALMLLQPGSTHAQSPVYQCRSGNTIYNSARPCGETAGILNSGSTRISRQGAAPEYTVARPPGRTGSMAPASEHLEFMSVPCVDLAEAIRTGAARGVNGSTIAELQRDYNAKCSDDDREARQRLSEKRSSERAQQQSERNAVRAERERSALQVRQCDEMLRILHNRRKRVDSMAEGEKADLARSEANYRERCARN